ncbi:class 1 fructose-bisphosphatase [Ferrimonas balearica]|uniref:class 1 fructose-bisphosphatase n=1 Tax=Ferrimonas balearica TaxID=44012 RepID=UPI001F2022FB|nr:class 1 fructose-bisphosphatase [Ferrimonas balearica]MBY6018755.1 class 1 fructose-bisphosphatase [Halomonas denitrificans]MBY6095945.1 class 1 fructose-bisphosphatase [Ferrimonas balearica]
MHTLQETLSRRGVDGELLTLIQSLASCATEISALVRGGALAGVLGATQSENVQGETQKKLDVIANDLIKQALQAQPLVKGVASEEEDDVVAANADGRFLVSFDPLDGSSNIDINSLVGTIFSVLPAPAGEVNEAAFLQPGENQLAACYMLYGPATVMALTTGDGTLMFTLDPKTGDFILVEEQVSIPADTAEFAINMSNQRFWQPAMQSYIADCLLGKEGQRGKNFNMRWIAAMVGDVHRVLSRGGLFTYPQDTKNPEKPFKLRLMYEANPMSFLVEQAGGVASTGYERIMAIQPEGIHQRVAVILGSKNEVNTCLEYHR